MWPRSNLHSRPEISGDPYYYENSPLYPVIAQLERASGFARENPPATRLEKLGTLLAQSAGSSEETALIGELLALPHPDNSATAHLTPQRRKEKTLDGTALAERVAGKALPPAVVAQITARADRIPLFVEEPTRALIETGALRDQGSRYELDQPLPLLTIPRGVCTHRCWRASTGSPRHARLRRSAPRSGVSFPMSWRSPLLPGAGRRCAMG
jgi:hypothetical protein